MHAANQRRSGHTVRAGWGTRIAALSRARISPQRAALALAGLVALGVVLGLLVAQTGRTIHLTRQNSILPVDSLLSIELTSGEARLRVEVISTAEATQARSEWAAAWAALPEALQPASPLYVVRARGSAELQLRFATGDYAVDGTSPEPYHWDAAHAEWRFMPYEQDAATIVSAAAAGPVVLLAPQIRQPRLAATLEAGASTDGSADLVDWLLVAGALIGEDGALQTDSLLQDVPEGVPALALIRASDVASLNAALSSERSRAALIEDAIALVEGQTWAGLALDFGPLPRSQSEAFSALLDGLSEALATYDRQLAVRVPAPASTASGLNTYGYAWEQLGAIADAVILDLSGPPVDEAANTALLEWATTRVSRSRLFVTLPALSLDEVGGHYRPISYDYALAPLGTVSLALEGTDAALQPQPGVPLTFRLSGQASRLEQVATDGLYRYEVYAGDGKHRVWIITARALRSRLDWIAAQGIAGAVIDGLFDAGSSPGATAAVREFRAGQPASALASLTVKWVVRDASGALLSETASDIAAPLEWTPERAGQYTVSADLVGESVSRRGAASVLVSDPIVPESVVAAVSPADRPDFIFIPEGMPLPVWPPGLAAEGTFELGGQVNHTVRHPVFMRQAKMSWVKFQLTWGPGQRADSARSLIDQGHGQGFKVLLSITGGGNYPGSIATAEYVEFLRAVAAYSPDAIEVWNEPNFYFEWPKGHIDGGAYVRDMLAPAYNAIKEVNPGIMVISGAPLPTGLYYSEGGCSVEGYGCDDWFYLQQMAQAGAANYMDCVGAHYNSGATAPSATMGHPADPGYQHYSWYFGSMLQLYGGTFGHPVCFTELGYLSPEGYGGLPGSFNWATDTTIAEQAAWLAEAVQISRQSGQVRLLIVWNVDFTDQGSVDPKGGYAIVRPDGSCPACTALASVMP